MIASNLNDKEQVIWDDIKDKTTNQGVAVFMMGIPGSGKSTTVNIVLENMGLSKDEFIDIDPDNFMAALDGYNNTKASIYNLSGVMMASKIMNRINKSGNKYKYIYYGTGKNFQNYITLINKAKKNAHRTVLVNVKIDVSTAIERASKRSRDVNTKTITNINNRLKQKHTRTIARKKVDLTNFEILREKVDIVYVVDNNRSGNPIIEYTNFTPSNSSDNISAFGKRKNKSKSKKKQKK